MILRTRPLIYVSLPMMRLSQYKFRSNSDLCLTGDLRQMLPGVIAYGILFDLNLYELRRTHPKPPFIPTTPRATNPGRWTGTRNRPTGTSGCCSCSGTRPS